MNHIDLRTLIQTLPIRAVAIELSLIGCNLFFNVLANISFKLSAINPSLRGFLTWQVIGNLSGFITVLTLTGLLKYLPLHVAFPITSGLAVIGVQVIGARFFFGESIASSQWLGTLLVVIGIVLITER